MHTITIQKQALEMVEDELIEDYVENSLSKNESENFERNFVWTNQRKQKLLFTERMKQYAAHKKNRTHRWDSLWVSWRAFWRFKNPILSWSLVTAIFIIVGGGFGALTQIGRLDEAVETTSLALKHEQDRRNQLERELALLKENRVVDVPSPASGQVQPTLFAMALSPSRIRDSGIGVSTVSESNPKFVIPPETDHVELKLAQAPQNYARYRAILKTVGGDEIWRQVFPRPERVAKEQPLRLTLDAEILIYEDYVLDLSGVTPEGNFENTIEYSFRIRDE